MDKAFDSRIPTKGASPACFVCRFGDRVNARQAAEAVADIAASGCPGSQLEVYHRQILNHENLCIRPDAGSIDRAKWIDALDASGHHGPCDFEMICPVEDVPSEYRKAINFLDHRMRDQAAAACSRRTAL